jgi:hypothetical protein
MGKSEMKKVSIDVWIQLIEPYLEQQRVLQSQQLFDPRGPALCADSKVASPAH